MVNVGSAVDHQVTLGVYGHSEDLRDVRGFLIDETDDARPDCVT